jgi:hypothetical protein
MQRRGGHIIGQREHLLALPTRTGIGLLAFGP